MAAAVQLVGPAEDEEAGGAGLEGVLDLPPERRGLSLAAVAAAIESGLGDEQRPVAAEVLQTCQVRGVGLLLLEEDVAGGEVEKGQLQVLGRGKVDVGEEALGVYLLRRPEEALEEALDALLAVPANDPGRDLVPDRVAEDEEYPAPSATWWTARATIRSLSSESSRKATCCSQARPGIT